MELIKFHGVLRAASSLDDVIRIHHEQYAPVLRSFSTHLIVLYMLAVSRTSRAVCFSSQRYETSPLRQLNAFRSKSPCLQMTTIHKAVISILDMCIVFSQSFSAIAGDNTFDTSRIASYTSRRHRSRRLRQEQKDVVSFADYLPPGLDDDEDSDSELDESLITEFDSENRSYNLSDASYEDGDVSSRNDRVGVELDGLVRFIRRAVEGLATGENNVSSFEILAFALQDWDA